MQKVTNLLSPWFVPQVRFCYKISPCQILVNYGNIKITQHALSVSVFKPLKLDTRQKKKKKQFVYSKSRKNMDTCAKDIHCGWCLKRSQAWKSKCHSSALNPKLYIRLFFYRCAYFVGERVSVSLWWCEIHFGPGQPDESTSMRSWVVHRCCGWARMQQRWSRHNRPARAFRLITEQAQSQSAPHCCLNIGGVQFPLLFFPVGICLHCVWTFLFRMVHRKWNRKRNWTRLHCLAAPRVTSYFFLGGGCSPCFFVLLPPGHYCITPSGTQPRACLVLLSSSVCLKCV